MDCRHEHLRTVGSRLFCKDCGKELPLEILTAKETPKKAENQPEKTAPVEKTDKPTSRKARQKKAV
jgi:hypothetical protein